MKIKGRVRWNPRGYAFVEPESGHGDDVFVPPEGLFGAIDGDIVEVWAYRDKKGLRGEVLSILQRTRSSISGRYRAMKKGGILEPLDPFPYTIIIPYGSQSDANSGDVVLATIDPPRQIKKTRTVTGRIEHRLDIPEDIGDDLRFIAIKHGLPWRFSENVQRQAHKVSTIDFSFELNRRTDLRERALFTIDGINAKDFDDAIGAEKLKDGTYLVTVAIADVAHVVQQGSPLDAEAFSRCFSVYFPEAAIPMLPEVLSNGIMSLQPYADRLAMVVEMHLGPRGRLIDYTCFEAVIRSRARLTYEEVNPFLAGQSGPPSEDIEISSRLVWLHVLAENLRKRRSKRGSLDFDIPEVGITIGHDGDVDRVYRINRGPAERLIEEFMLCANHTVCAFLEKNKMPVLYRIHEPPNSDDLMVLARTLKEIGLAEDVLSQLYSSIRTGKHVPRILQDITRHYQGTHLEGFVNQHILRSLMRARYSQEDLGHFGLATNGYLHFTSPIRRYPDIIIHRILKVFLASGELPQKKGHAKLKGYLKFVSNEISNREQKTNDAMFEVIRLKVAAYMIRHVGDVFEGVVTSILAFGMFVEIFDPPIDGLVSSDEMDNARIRKGKKIKIKKRTISMGDTVKVRLVRVDPVRGHLDFTLV
jgi:ribonuclease R